jgi:RimJ/RimL family protein N-acetyltransferase
MGELRQYSAGERLRDGRACEIRAIAPGDREGLLAAVDRVSAQSMFLRFFRFKRGLGADEVERYVDVDFVGHVALVAVAEEGGRQVIVGGGRYFVFEPGSAELAFAVVDAYQGQGIAAALLRHLVAIARARGLRRLVADVLPENTAMLRVLEKSGLSVKKARDQGVMHVALQL